MDRGTIFVTALEICRITLKEYIKTKLTPASIRLASARNPGYARESTVEETTVKFGRDISDEMLLAYVRVSQPFDSVFSPASKAYHLRLAHMRRETLTLQSLD